MITDLFYRGEPLYMIVLTLSLLAVTIISTVVGISVSKRNKTIDTDQIWRHLYYLKSIGLFALMFGLFTQLLGLYGALTAIKEWGGVSPAVLSDGLQTSSIPSLYGLLIFLCAHLVRKGLVVWIDRMATAIRTKR